MNRLTKKIGSLVLITALGVTTLTGCKKEVKSFPSSPIQIIVPFSAGGGTDTVTRAVANAAKDKFSQPLVVVNKTGAGGAVGIGEGANAKADGYTVTTICSELSTLPAQNLATFTNKDFRPIMQLNAEPASITVKADAPYNTVKEFFAYAKANEGKVIIGNSGVGAIWHLAALDIEKAAGVKFNHIPYEGASPAIAALLGGHIQAVTVSPAEVAAQVKAGQLKMLAVADNERSKEFPDVPTLKESGYDVVIGTWRGLAVPKDTPDDVYNVLKDGFAKAVADPSFTGFMAKSGLNIKVLVDQDFVKKLDDERTLFTELVKGFKK
ncbi:tripartite tricarboxylate transporter substrate binding protein [Clostridium sp.]